MKESDPPNGEAAALPEHTQITDSTGRFVDLLIGSLLQERLPSAEFGALETNHLPIPRGATISTSIGS